MKLTNGKKMIKTVLKIIIFGWACNLSSQATELPLIPNLKYESLGMSSTFSVAIFQTGQASHQSIPSYRFCLPDTEALSTPFYLLIVTPEWAYIGSVVSLLEATESWSMHRYSGYDGEYGDLSYELTPEGLQKAFRTLCNRGSASMNITSKGLKCVLSSTDYDYDWCRYDTTIHLEVKSLRVYLSDERTSPPPSQAIEFLRDLPPRGEDQLRFWRRILGCYGKKSIEKTLILISRAAEKYFQLDELRADSLIVDDLRSPEVINWIKKNYLDFFQAAMTTSINPTEIPQSVLSEISRLRVCVEQAQTTFTELLVPRDTLGTSNRQDSILDVVFRSVSKLFKYEKSTGPINGDRQEIYPLRDFLDILIDPFASLKLLSILDDEIYDSDPLHNIVKLAQLESHENHASNFFTNLYNLVGLIDNHMAFYRQLSCDPTLANLPKLFVRQTEIGIRAKNGEALKEILSLVCRAEDLEKILGDIGAHGKLSSYLLDTLISDLTIQRTFIGNLIPVVTQLRQLALGLVPYRTAVLMHHIMPSILRYRLNGDDISPVLLGQIHACVS